MSLSFEFSPIGMIHTPFATKEATPIQSSRSDAFGTVEILPEYLDGLEGIEGFSHIILIYAFHQSTGKIDLKVKPFLDDALYGVFATRYPKRPNSIGLSVVQLIRRDQNILEIQGVDMLDSTPLLDIKPYIPEFDIHTPTKIGWYATRSHQ